MLTPPLDDAAIARLVPHQGGMCLLDRALDWDAAQITCETAAHAAPDNPLRRDGSCRRSAASNSRRRPWRCMAR